MPDEYYAGEFQDIAVYQALAFVKAGLKPFLDGYINYDPSEEEVYEVEKLACSASERLMVAHSGLVNQIAYAYYRPMYGVGYDDLVQEGRLGLLEAARRYKTTRNAKFSTYAVYWIRAYITRYIQNNGGSIRIPIHIQQAIRKLGKAKEEFRLRGKSSPRETEVLDATGLSWSKLGLASLGSQAQRVDRIEANFRFGHHYSGWIDQEGESRRPYNWEERLADSPVSLEDTVADRLMKGVVAELLKVAGLSKRERRIIELRYGLTKNGPKTLEEVGKLFKVKRERIRQIERKALEKLGSWKVRKAYPDLIEEYHPVGWETPQRNRGDWNSLEAEAKKRGHKPYKPR